MAVPKLRFNNMGFIDITTLGSVTELSGKKNKELGNYESYSINNIDGFVPQDEQFESGNYSEADKSMYFIVSPGSFAYNPARINVGSIGYQNLDKDVIVSSLYEVFKTTDKCDAQYLWQFMHTRRFNDMVVKYAEGGVRQYLFYKNFCRIKVNLPSIDEQKKIAEFLTTFDKRIAAQQNIIADLEETKKGLLQKIFSQELRFKDANGQDYPDWEEKRLVAISELITVGIANSATHAYTENGVVMFRNLNIKPNELDELDIIHISTEFAQKYEKKTLQENDILVCRTGYPGTACIVPKKYSGAQTFTTLIVRLNHAEADVKYVCQYINSDIGKKYFESTQIGGGQKNSGAGILSKMPIKIPCMEEQRKIADFLSTFDKKITAEKQILSDLLEIKKGLLQQMFV